MKSNDDLHDASMIEHEGADWIARRAGGLTSAEAAEFDCGWRADERRAAAVARLEAAEDRLRGLARFADDGEFLAMLPAAGAAAHRFRWEVWLPWAVAASIAALFFLARFTPADRDAATLFSTTKDGYQRLMLAGTMVQLNERTAIRATADSAMAELLHGEACVTVVPGGTAFSLRVRDRVVHCATGTVVVRHADEILAVFVTAGAAEIRGGTGEPLRLSAGTRLTMDASGAAPARPDHLAPAQMQELLAWQAPRIPLAQTRLADAIEQFNLYNWEQFELADRTLGEQRVSGVFRADNADAFAAYLRREHRIVTERVNRTSSSDRNSPGGISLLLRVLP